MKQLAFAIGLLLLGVGAAVPARADFGVIKFPSGYCRVWDNTAAGPQEAITCGSGTVCTTGTTGTTAS